MRLPPSAPFPKSPLFADVRIVCVSCVAKALLSKAVLWESSAHSLKRSHILAKNPSAATRPAGEASGRDAARSCSADALRKGKGTATRLKGAEA